MEVHNSEKFISRLFLFILLSFLAIGLTACTENDSDQKEDKEEEVSASEKTEKNSDTKDEDEQADESSEIDDMDEETSDPLANFLETAPDIPTNLEEMVNYPTGPLAGNGNVRGKDPLLSNSEMAKEVKEILPEIEENADEEYLNEWWRAYRFLFAEDYPDPTQIMTQMSFDHFGNPGLDDERFHFKDQINILIILDVSGSMANTIDGKAMIDIAKDSINDFVPDIPEEANVGLRVYGHEGKPTGKTKEESCQSSDLVHDIQPLDKQAFADVIEPFQPTGWTPIGLSLEEAKDDFSELPSEKNTNLVYAVSDGAETCGGAPAAAAKELDESDVQSIVNVIGFNVDVAGQSHLREIAEEGGGLYTDAGNEEQLQESFEQAKQIIKEWKEWKGGAQKDLYKQKREQRVETIFQENDWQYLNMDEDFVMRDVLWELLDDQYITKDAVGFFEEKRNEREKLYQEVQETTYQDLLDEIEENYEEKLNDINEEYDENVGE